MTRDVKKHPVVVIIEIFGCYEKTECATLKTCKLVPKRIGIGVPAIAARNNELICAADWNNRLSKTFCATDRKGSRGQLTGNRKSL